MGKLIEHLKRMGYAFQEGNPIATIPVDDQTVTINELRVESPEGQLILLRQDSTPILFPGDTDGIPENDPEAACRILLADQRRLLDLGRVTDEQGRTEIFHNHLGGAIEAAIAIESLKLRHLRGLWLYLTAVLRVIPRYTRAPQMTVHYNGTTETRPLLMASAANGGRSGGGFKIAPDARLDDGELDLVLADSPNIAVTLWLLPHVLAGTHVRQTRYVNLHRTPRVVLEAPAGIPVHLDGETFRTDARRIEVEILPRRLQVITAANA